MPRPRTAAHHPEPAQRPSAVWLPASDDQSCVRRVSYPFIPNGRSGYKDNVTLITDYCVINDEFNDLIPEMQAWNNGAGIDPLSWVGCEGRIELAIGYALVFWPRFVVIDDYVLREGCAEASLREWQRLTKGDRKAVEAVMNHWHMLDLHQRDSEATEAQLRYLGRTLKQVHEVKLRSDYPDRIFVVRFNDEPDLNLIEYQLSFWQEPT